MRAYGRTNICKCERQEGGYTYSRLLGGSISITTTDGYSGCSSLVERRTNISVVFPMWPSVVQFSTLTIFVRKTVKTLIRHLGKFNA